MPDTAMSLAKVLAIESGVKNNQHRTITDMDKVHKRREFFNAQNKTYEPLRDDGEPLPPEVGLISIRVADELDMVRPLLSKWFDLAATREVGNAIAKADLTIGGRTIKDVPALTLVFLDEQLRNLFTFASRCPVLDAPIEQWIFDANDKLHKTRPIKTTRTTKVPKVITKAEATERFQAQTEVYFNDETIGTYSLVKLSSAMTPADRENMLDRIREAQEAVKFSRVQANQAMVEPVTISDVVLGHIFG